MAELNIGALTDSTSYIDSFGTTNTYDLYKFNITSLGSFKKLYGLRKVSVKYLPTYCFFFAV
jgi:hypothetical protein